MNNRAEFDYKKYLQLIIKHRYLFVALSLLLMTAATVMTCLKPDRYEARCTVFIEKSIINELVKGIAVAPSFDDKLRVLSYSMTSRALLLKVFDDLKLNTGSGDPVQKEKMVKDFQKRTDVKLKDQQGIFIISFVDRDPRLARDYVNTLVRRYIEESTSSKREESSDATKVLEEQIAAVKARLDESEALVDGFRRNNAGVLGQSEGTLLAEISEAQEKIEDVQQKRQQLESMLVVAKKSDPMQAKLASLLGRQKELSLVYTELHPEVVSLESEIAFVREQLASGRSRSDLASAPSAEVQKISMEINSLRAVEKSQRRIIASKQQLLRSIPAARSNLGEVERELNSQKTLYGQLMARLTQTELAKDMGVQDKSTTFRLVEPAILPVSPVDQKRSRMLLLGIMGSLVGSLGLLVLRDYLDSSVRSVDALKALGVQVLAVVPVIETQAEVQAVRRRDIWFFTLAGTYFVGILATVSLELMR